MANMKSVVAKRARGILRLAVLWARRGCSFKRGLMVKSIRAVLKNLLTSSGSGARIRYLEREFPSGETPAFKFKIHWPVSLRMPCVITPAVDFDNEDDWMFYKGENEKYDAREDYYLSDDEEEEEEEDNSIEVEEEEEQEINLRAEEFIANFHDQVKMQRQVSLLAVQMRCFTGELGEENRWLMNDLTAASF